MNTRMIVSNGEITECLNLFPNDNGSMLILDPTKNAVIVQLIRLHDEDGGEYFKRIVSIECKDMEMYDNLMIEAHRILNEQI